MKGTINLGDVVAGATIPIHVQTFDTAGVLAAPDSVVFETVYGGVEKAYVAGVDPEVEVIADGDYQLHFPTEHVSGDRHLHARAVATAGDDVMALRFRADVFGDSIPHSP